MMSLSSRICNQGKDALVKIEELQKKITEQRNVVKGIEPKPKVFKKEKPEKVITKKTATKATPKIKAATPEKKSAKAEVKKPTRTK